MVARRFVAAILLLSCAPIFSARGPATGAELPRPAQPDLLERRFEVPELPHAGPEIQIPPAERALPPEQARKVRFVLAGVVFEGMSVYTADDVAPLYDALQAKEVSLADIYGVAEALTARYRQDGYVLSRAIVPGQRPGLGIVRIKVIEGYIDQVLVRGRLPSRPGLIQAMAEKLTRDRPLRLSTLQRYTTLIDDLPGLAAKTALEPSDAHDNAYNLILQISLRRFEGYGTVDNRGSEFVGPYQAVAALTLNSPFGGGGQTQLRVAGAAAMSEFRFADLTQFHVLNAEGTGIGVRAAVSDSEPGATLEEQDIHTRTVQFGLDLRHPLLRSPRQGLYVLGSIFAYDSDGTTLGVTSQQDRVRAIRMGVNWSRLNGGYEAFAAEFVVSHGLSGLGASPAGAPNLSRPDASGEFLKAGGSLARRYKLSPGWFLKLSAVGQKSDGPLLAVEEFTLGGGAIGRAHDPAEIGGDDGAGASAELRRTGKIGKSAASRYELYGYLEGGAVWNRSSEGTGTARDALAGVGLGVDFILGRYLFGSVEVAQPLVRDYGGEDSGNRGPRLFFRAGARF